MRLSGLTILLLSAALAQEALADQLDFKWIREIRCEQIRPYSDDMCAFKENGKWGFMDTSGNVVIAPQFDECYDFADGHAIVKKGPRWGIIDKTGKSSTGFVFSKMNDFSDGIAYAEENNLCFYVYPDGKKQPLSAKFTYGDFSEGLAPVMKKKNRKWGYINKKGIVSIEPAYDSVYSFSNGIALVKNNKKNFYINKKGSRRNISELKSNEPLHFVNGYAKIKTDKGIQFLDSRLKLLNFSAADATDFNKDGIAAILMKDNTMRYINTAGRAILPVEYDKMGNFSEGLAWVSSNGKYGYIDGKGTLVIDTLFTSATDFNDGVAFVSYNGRMGSIKVKEESDIIPDLVIEDIAIKDANLNSRVEAEETFAIAVTLHNPTGEDLHDVNLQFAGEQSQAEWFDFDGQSVYLPQVRANSDTTVTFGGSANIDLVSDKINLEFRGLASNMKDPVTAQYSFEAMGVNACKPLITKYWVYKDNHTPISAGDVANLMLTVTNDGSDLAKDVTVDLQWPEGISGVDNEMKIPLIKPGESAEITSRFTVDSLMTDSLSRNGLTVVAKLSEYTRKHKDIKYLSFYTGRMNAEVNLESGAPAMMYQYTPDSRYVAQNTQSMGAPQIVTSASSAGTQEIVKEDENMSELLAGLTPVVAADPNKFALVIGNEDYNSFKQSTTYEVNVDYAENDADAFAAYATDYMGVPKENVILLHNATYAQMNFNINKLLMMSKTNPGNVELYLFYAGHGQHDVDSKETYLMPVDVSISSPTAGIKLEKLYADLGESQAKKTYVFLDACYSGVGRGIVIKPKETPINGNTVVFTATSSTQRSMPYKEKQHGMFTYFLLKTMRDTNGNVTVGTLFDATRREVVKNSIWINNSEQTPELLSGEGIESGWKDWKLQ